VSRPLFQSLRVSPPRSVSGLSLLIASLFVAPIAFAEDKVDTSPLAVEAVRAYPNLKVRRPVVIDNAADGSGRLFVCTQQGVIHIMPEDENGKVTATFLDIESQVQYADKMNEEGLLGLAFHPNYKKNGEFFLYYTAKEPERTSVISRWKVSADDPNKADPESEEVLLTIKQPFWNHNGGTILFGPDGYLYVALGDGGKANDPFNNAQNLNTLLGSVLRIDIDKTEGDKKYAIPADNPFKGKGGDVKEEIFAYGLRNPWRVSFDRKTGEFWCADVGQNLYEEINLLTSGGNYGWNLREGFHKFGDEGSEPSKDLIEPIWEYPHDVGKSITGGHVYRGTKAPSLQGHYLYADYVTGLLWALKYDSASEKVVANRKIEGKTNPYITYGEDEAGEVYVSDSFGNLFRFQEK
jgi:glucose/arabinose dehydrogenase